MPAQGALRVVTERKLDALLAAGGTGRRLEASGVCVKGGSLFVVFDNLRDVGKLPPDLQGPGTLIPHRRREASDFEDITADDQYFYVVVERADKVNGDYYSEVLTFDDSFDVVNRELLEVPLEHRNKLFEGLAHVRRGGRDYLLALCEGNRCKGGAEGAAPGGGRVHIFRRRDDAGKRRWRHVGRMRLPAALPFEDYAGLDVAGDRIAVVSQQSAALWIGTLAGGAWRVAGDGLVYPFPRDAAGHALYGAVEGVAWLGGDRVVLVSDRVDPAGGTAPQRRRDQSVHVFDLLPAGA